jgi:hypothetical protein
MNQQVQLKISIERSISMELDRIKMIRHVIMNDQDNYLIYIVL